MAPVQYLPQARSHTLQRQVEYADIIYLSDWLKLTDH